MQPLIDADIIQYQIAAVSETEEGPRNFDYCAEVAKNLLDEICLLAGGTKPPVLFFTGKDNFREQVAVTKPYKGTRLNEKPYHFDNLKVWLHNQYDCITVPGLEADDLMQYE